MMFWVFFRYLGMTEEARADKCVYRIRRIGVEDLLRGSN